MLTVHGQSTDLKSRGEYELRLSKVLVLFYSTSIRLFDLTQDQSFDLLPANDSEPEE